MNSAGANYTASKVLMYILILTAIGAALFVRMLLLVNEQSVKERNDMMPDYVSFVQHHVKTIDVINVQPTIISYKRI